MSLGSKSNVRADFSMLQKKMHGKNLIYLDSAATSFKPQSVIDAIINYYQNECSSVNRSIYELSENSTAKFHEARITTQKFINAQSEKEIIFTSGTTASINLVAYSYCEAFLKPGDDILVPEIEHHSNLVPWQLAAKRCGAKLKFIPVLDSTELDLNALKELLNQKTKLVSIAHISNVFGTHHPIKEIVKIIREHSNAKIFLDGAQSAPHIKIDVQDLDVDFFAFSAHKLYGPTGVGVLYGKEELLDKMPPFLAGGDMIEEVDLTKTSYNKLPYKFEAGTPNIAGVIGLKAAIDYLQKNLDEALEKEVLNYALKQFSVLSKVKVIGSSKNRAALISFVVEGVHSLDIATLLNFKGIALRSGHLCAQPSLKRFNQSSLLRISFGIYTTKEDIDSFVEALQEVISSIQP